MKRVIWDIETDGLLQEATKVFTIVLKDVDTGEVISACDAARDGYRTIGDALAILAKAEERIGHNTLKFDCKVIEKLYPGTLAKGLDTDTMILAQLKFPDIKERDGEKLSNGTWSKEFFSHKGKSLFGKHSLAAWGKRIGTFKDEYEGSFDKWAPEMQAYAEQDLETTYQLWRYLCPEDYSQEAIRLEHDIVKITHQMELDGIPFDLKGAIELQATLATRKEKLRSSLTGLFEPWEVVVKEAIAKVNSKKLGRVKGEPYKVVKTVYFNPGSREHIAKCLIEKYGWKPSVFTPTGKPKIDDEVLEELEYPEALALAEYFTVCKLLGYLVEGDKAWLNYYDEKHKVIHAHYEPMGTVTSRSSHHSPNIGQVPSVDKPYGKECRNLFGRQDGMCLVGTDMSGLELRCLAHYMAHLDRGKYAEVILETDDIHLVNMKAAGLSSRKQAKTLWYAILYGAGLPKIGSITGGGFKAGKDISNKFYKEFPALKKLINICKSGATKGYLNGLDGRRVPVRSEHAALNTLLQSAGAIICKRWVVEMYKQLPKDSRFACWVHDELQIICKPEDAEYVGNLSKRVAHEVAEHYKLKCPLDTEYKIGNNWAECH